LPPRPHKLSEDLRQLLDVHDREAITIGETVGAMGRSGFGLLLLILALPSALPVPAPGYSTPFGVVLAILGLQLVCGRNLPWLPQWAHRIQIKRSTAQKMIGGAAKFFGKVEHLIRPRFPWLSGKTGLTVAGCVVTFMGVLMAIPIPGTNTAPAMVIFLTGIAIAEKDGALLVLALVGGVAAAAFYTVIIWILITYGAAGISEAREILRGWFSH
jgi:hypothetical protein